MYTIINHIFYLFFRLPVDKYPVVALRGAPAPFPIAEENIPLAKYLQWSESIEEEANSHIQKLTGGDKFIGIHLRNGIDWVIFCCQTNRLGDILLSDQ
jgi:peptide-O-fucosyltransferase